MCSVPTTRKICKLLLESFLPTKFRQYFRIDNPFWIFFCVSVVLESIWYCTKANRLTNETNTTAGMKKVGRIAAVFEPVFLPSLFRSFPTSTDTSCTQSITHKTAFPVQFFSVLQSYCSRISVVFLSYDSRLTPIRLDRRKKILVELPSLTSIP